MKNVGSILAAVALFTGLHAVAGPTLKLVNKTESTEAIVDSPLIFLGGAEPYVLHTGVVCSNVIVKAALDHQVKNTFAIPRPLAGNPATGVIQKDGEPYLFLWDVCEHTPLFGNYPLVDKNATELQPKGFERRAVRTFVANGDTYALFMGRSAGGMVPFALLNLTTGKESEFRVEGSAWTNHFDVLEYNGRFWGVFTGSTTSIDGAVVFDIFRDFKQKDIFVHFPFEFPNGTSGGKLFTHKGEPVVPLMDNRLWWRERIINVQFTRPFGEGAGPTVGEGILPPFQFTDAILTAGMGKVEHATVDMPEASFFTDSDGVMRSILPIQWQEGNITVRRTFIFSRDGASLTQVQLPAAPFRPNGVLGASDGREAKPVQVFKGPGGKHFGFHLDQSGMAYVIDLVTGRPVHQLKIPALTDTWAIISTPVLFTRKVGAKTEYYVYGYTSDYDKTIEYTLQIAF